MKNYKVISFDLDGTLTKSRGDLEPEMSALLTKLLDRYTVAVMSGGGFTQYQKQFLQHLEKEAKVKNLILLPTSGATCYIYQDDAWTPLYKHEFSETETQEVLAAITKALELSQFDTSQPVYGSRIQIRGTQISFSGLGDEAPLEEKEAWDPQQKKRLHIVSYLQPLLPNFSIRLGGTTTIDITQKGIDKAYGIRALAKYLNLPEEEIFYIGDALYEGGNDQAALQTNAHTKQTSGPEETKEIISALLA